ncbi:MAG: aminopeptidase [Thermoplasmata archaeon]|nr:aminopeptidase [Thermoplasmata archaeon]
MTPSVTEAQADRLARNVLLSRLDLKPKEKVIIETYPSSLVWANGFVREARRRGASPILHYEDESSYWTAIEEGQAGLIGAPADHEMAALAEADVYIYFWGPENLARRWKLNEKTQEQATAFNSRWYEVARKNGVRGARMGIARATPENAKAFGVSYPAWWAELFAASTQDIRPLVRQAERLRKVLEKGGAARLTHPNGTDLNFALAERTMREGLGRVTPAEMKTAFGMMASVPEALVYISIDESTADGTIVANRPTRQGASPREGGRWTMTDGHLTEYHYKTGGKEFRAAYSDAPKGRDRPALLEIGLDPSVRVSPMLEESEAGAVSFGVGGNTAYGGKTRVPFLDWLTVGGAELSVNGRTIVRRGRVV